MSREGKAFGAAFAVAIILNLAWFGFVVWAIYTLVSWLVTK